MSFGMNYNCQLDWWNQPVDNLHRSSITQHCRSDSINASGYPLQQQNSECGPSFFTPAHVNDAYLNTQLIPNYWIGDMPQFTETSIPFALTPNHTIPGAHTSQCIPLPSLPPAAFSKEPLPIDQYSNNGLVTFDNTSRNSFFHDQILPLSDVPALEYDSTPDVNAYERRQWTDSPMPDEVDGLAGSGETDDSLENSDPCYAELLRQALMEKKDDHTMLLKDLYEWVRTHSSKAQESGNKGWQNSVRHNLSMNAVGTSDRSSVALLLIECRHSKESLHPTKKQARKSRAIGDLPSMLSRTALVRLLAIAKTASARRNAIPIPHRSESRRVRKVDRPLADRSAVSAGLPLHLSIKHPPLTRHISTTFADDISFASIPSLKPMCRRCSKDSLRLHQPTRPHTLIMCTRCSAWSILVRQMARFMTTTIFLGHIPTLSPILTGLHRLHL